MALARRRDVVVRVMRRPGHFVAPHRPLASVRPPAQSDDALADAIRDVFVVGSQLTLAQNVEFAVDQLSQPNHRRSRTCRAACDHLLRAGSRRHLARAPEPAATKGSSAVQQ